MNQLQAVLNAYQSEMLLGSLVLNLIILVMFLVTIVRSGGVRKQYQTLMRGVQKENLEELLLKQADIIHESLDQVNQLSMRTNKLETSIEACLQKTALVRFNAYDNMGSDLSFSLALLDQQDNGIVISSLYGREESRTYAKPVVGGNSTYPLSEEEKDAISQAKKSLLNGHNK